MATITFNNTYQNIKGLSYFDASGTTDTLKYIIRTNNWNVDLFPDSGVAVGDAVIFSADQNTSGKFNQLQLNIDVALVGVGITGVWEYTVGGTNNLPNWSVLPGVIDTSNGFTVTGVQTIAFDMPEDWDNFHFTSVGPLASRLLYGFAIRYIITAITSISEGGHLANIADANKVRGYTITCSDFLVGAPLTMAQIKSANDAGGWRVVSGSGNTYILNCNLDMKNSYFTSLKELIQFNTNFFYFGGTSCVWNIGENYSEQFVRYGTTIIFLASNVNYPSGNYYFGSEGSNIFGLTIKIVDLNHSIGINGYWGGIGQGANNKVLGMLTENFRQFNFNDSQNVYANIIGVGGISANHIETPGAIIKNVSIQGGVYCVRPNSNCFKQFMHQCDFSACTGYPFNPYYSTSIVAGFEFDGVDCNWGNFADNKLAYWIHETAKAAAPTTKHKLWKTFSAVLKLEDTLGSPIPNAQALLKRQDGNTEFSLSSNDDGYVAVEKGTATSGSTTNLADTSKAWTTDQFFYKEVLITSGAGAGQRTIIKKWNTATNLPFAFTQNVAIASSSKYIVIPYIRTKSVSPIGLTGATESVLNDNYNPFNLVIRKYGYQFLEVSLTVTEALKASYLVNVNAFVVANEATAGAYTGITINGSTKTITVSTAHTLQKVYDYSQWWASQSANMAYEEPITTTNGTVFTLATDWNIIIDGVLLDATGKQIQLTGTGIYSFDNGATIEGVLADVTHTHVKITAPNLIDGTRVYLINDTLGLEVDNSVVSGGLGYVLIADIPTANLASGNVVMLFATYCNGLTAKKELFTTGVLTTAGLYFIDAQEDCSVYAAIGIDGSTVTEFIADYPNIEVNIDDIDNVTTKQRLMAWWTYNTTTSSGIKYFFQGITAEDVSNYRINDDVVNLFLDNVKTTPLRFTDSARLYKKSGNTIISATSNSIQLDAGKVYTPKLDNLLTTEDYLALRN